MGVGPHSPWSKEDDLAHSRGADGSESRYSPRSVRSVAAIGAGGMGEVYRARDTRLGRDVALKLLPPALSADPDRLRRFEREAKTLAALNHPNIAQIYGVETMPTGERDIPAIAMEFVEGRTLERLIGNKFEVSDALPIAAQIADALEAAHDAGIVHRDLKPANIILKGAWGPTPTRLPDGSRSPTLASADVAAAR